jgi:hypothetical protein
MDRELATVLTKATKALERSAVANEKLLEIAEKEQFTVEQGPPVCPHCGVFNPEVTQLFREEASGPLSEFVMQCETHCCNRPVYCIAVGWDVVPHIEIARELLSMKKGGNHDGT